MDSVGPRSFNGRLEMKFSKLLKGAVLSLACCGILGGSAMAEAPKTAKKTSAVAISDVALGQGGQLVGQLVDKQGRGVEGAVVSVKFGNKEVAKTVTNAKGQYAVKGLRGGVHQVVAGRQVQVFRFWSAQTAPPAAKTAALSVLGSNGVVRGQLEGLGGISGTVGAVAGITGAVLSGVSASNSSDAEDAAAAAKAQAEANAAAIANLPTS